MFSKLSAAHYAVMMKFHVSNTGALQMIHFAYFHSVIKYEIIMVENLQTGYLYYKKGNLNYGWCEICNSMKKAIQGVRYLTCPTSIHIFIDICYG